MVQVNVDNMKLHEQLNVQIAEKLTRGPIFFIVMSKRTAELLVAEVTFNPPYKLERYQGYEVLISESLEFGEFRIG